MTGFKYWWEKTHEGKTSGGKGLGGLAWNKDFKEQAHFARSDTSWATSNERAAATPRTLWAWRATDTCKKKLLETLACCSQTPAWARKEVEGEFQVTNENKYSRWLCCCDRLIYLSHQGKSDCGWNIIFPDRPSTGAWRGISHWWRNWVRTSHHGKQGSDLLWTTAELLLGITMKGCLMQEKSHASETMSPICFLTKEKWDRHEV